MINKRKPQNNRSTAPTINNWNKIMLYNSIYKKSKNRTLIYADLADFKTDFNFDKSK